MGKFAFILGLVLTGCVSETAESDGNAPAAIDAASTCATWCDYNVSACNYPADLREHCNTTCVHLTKTYAHGCEAQYLRWLQCLENVDVCGDGSYSLCADEDKASAECIDQSSS